MPKRYLIKAATLSNGVSLDLLIADGKIIETGSISDKSAEIVDANGLIALSGFVDLHTHLREPGGESSETVLSGSIAAASGGWTAVHAMANTNPVADTAGLVEQVQQLGDEAGYVTVRPVGAVTRGLNGSQLSDIGAMASSKAKVRVFSDDGKCVSDSKLMRRAMEYIKGFGGVIAQHAQDPQLTDGAQMNESALSSRLGLTGWPAVAEESIIARDILLAKHLDARIHICHLSTAGSVEIVRWAKSKGIRVTAEVTPHHLLLTEDLVASYDARYKVNPPLRAKEDVLALRSALVEGVIDIVATDHAPHTAESKTCAWDEAAFGMVGLETALGITRHAMKDYDYSWQQLEKWFSHTPAVIGQLTGQGMPLVAGAACELTLVDPTVEYEVTNQALHGRSQNTPYLGISLYGKIEATFHNGYPTVQSGRPVTPAELAENNQRRNFN